MGSAEHTLGALDINAIPGVRRSPLLDEGGAVDHDLGAADIGRGHRIEIAPDRLGTDRCPSAVSRRVAAPPKKPRGAGDEDVYGVSQPAVEPQRAVRWWQ